MLSRRGAFAGLAVSFLRGQDKTQNMFSDTEAYERFMGRWSRLLAPLLVNFTEIPDSGQVLDIGSGTGALTFAIAEGSKNRRIVGIDRSKEYVAYATSKNLFPDRARFQVGDAQQLPFTDGMFDSSSSLLVINFIPDRVKAVSEMHRVTKPGGKISAAVWDYGSGMRMLRVFWDTAASIDTRAEKLDERHMPLCRAGELSQLWTSGGIINVDEQPLDIMMQFASFTDYWDAFLLGQGPAGAYVRTLDADRLKALRDEVKRRLSVANEGSPMALPARAWAVRGMVPARP
jgi:SAM-dependent methyltransferase